MDIQESRSVITSFLVGRRIERSVLQQAIEAMKADRDYAAHLCHVLGRQACWVTECDAFRSCLAEFAEMPPEQRQHDMPQSVAHLVECDECRRAYWQVVGFWRSAMADRQPVRRSQAPIIVRIGPEGQVQSDRSGLPPTPREAIAQAAAYQAEAGSPESWELEDDQSDLVVHLAVHSDRAGRAVLRCRIEQADGSVADPQQIRAELRDLRTGTIGFAGPLKSFERSGMVLEPGMAQLRLTALTQPGAPTWEIDLECGGDV